MTKKRRQVSEEHALRDFRTLDVPIRLRGAARALAQERGITPMEALVIIRAGEERGANGEKKLKQLRRAREGLDRAIEEQRFNKSPKKSPKKLKKFMRGAKRPRKSARAAGYSYGYIRFVQGGLPSLGKKR